jgi:hypothetical protein
MSYQLPGNSVVARLQFSSSSTISNGRTCIARAQWARLHLTAPVGQSYSVDAQKLNIKN